MDAASDFGTRLDHHLQRVSRRRGRLDAPQVAVRAPSLGIDYRSGGGGRRFHVASIGKAFTATLVLQLVERGEVDLDTPVAQLLAADEVDGLFAPSDASGPPTIHHLLTHTSGAADYFDGPVLAGRPVRDLIVGDPDRVWTPADLLEFSRRNQRPVGVPGERFAYSDTGYVLLGRIVEATTGRAFHEVLHERILTSLGLRDSALLFHSAPDAYRANGTGAAAQTTKATGRPAVTVAPTAAELQLAPLYLGRVEASGFAGLSCDWAGGGLVSTTDDLVRFSRALHHGELLSAGSVAYLTRPRHRFRAGIRYGAGAMELRFGEFSPLLARFPRPVGHIGVLATHLFHDPVHDAEIAMNFAATDEMVRSFRTLIRIEQELLRAARRGARMGTPTASG